MGPPESLRCAAMARLQRWGSATTAAEPLASYRSALEVPDQRLRDTQTLVRVTGGGVESDREREVLGGASVEAATDGRNHPCERRSGPCVDGSPSGRCRRVDLDVHLGAHVGGGSIGAGLRARTAGQRERIRFEGSDVRDGDLCRSERSAGDEQGRRATVLVVRDARGGVVIAQRVARWEVVRAEAG